MLGPLSANAGDITLGRLEEEHVSGGTAIYLQAFADNTSGKLGPAYARSYLRWFMGEPNSIALGAWRQGHLLGFAVGAPLGYQKQLNRDLAGVVLRCLLTQPRLFLNREIMAAIRGRLMVQIGAPRKSVAMPRVPEPIMCFVGAGLAAAARGLGIGTFLYSGFQEECRRRANVRSIRGITHKENVPPCRILTGLGWLPLHEDEHGYVSWYKILE